MDGNLDTFNKYLCSSTRSTFCSLFADCYVIHYLKDFIELLLSYDVCTICQYTKVDASMSSLNSGLLFVDHSLVTLAIAR